MSWSRVSVFLLLLVASSCLEAVEHVKNDIQHDSPPDSDDPAASEATTGDTDLQKQCCEQGKQSADAPGACVGKARRYVKTLTLDDDNDKLCRVAFSGCCKAEKTAPEKDVKQLGGGPTEKEGATKKKAPKAKRGDQELRTSCCERGRQSIRQRGSCDVKAQSYVRTLTQKRGKAKLCRMLFTGCCNRASRVPSIPENPDAEVRQLGGTTPSEGDANEKGTEPAWKRRLDNRCCNAGKRSAAATPGSCQSRARTTVRKAIARSRVGKSHGRGTTRTDMAACGQTFIRCCNEVPIA